MIKIEAIFELRGT